VIGTDAVANPRPDGYTLLMMSNAHTVNETLVPVKPFQLMRDLAVARSTIPTWCWWPTWRCPPPLSERWRWLRPGWQGQPRLVRQRHAVPHVASCSAWVYLVHIPYRGSSGAHRRIGGQVDGCSTP
jgi:hypothetical protein